MAGFRWVVSGIDHRCSALTRPCCSQSRPYPLYAVFYHHKNLKGAFTRVRFCCAPVWRFEGTTLFLKHEILCLRLCLCLLVFCVLSCSVDHAPFLLLCPHSRADLHTRLFSCSCGSSSWSVRLYISRLICCQSCHPYCIWLPIGCHSGACDLGTLPLSLCPRLFIAKLVTASIIHISLKRCFSKTSQQ